MGRANFYVDFEDMMHEVLQVEHRDEKDYKSISIVAPPHLLPFLSFFP